jgi:hypothetical protein
VLSPEEAREVRLLLKQEISEVIQEVQRWPSRLYSKERLAVLESALTKVKGIR